ncbi:hypothetical protein [Alteromonas sp. AMM-1]|uniref:hypothetical protein n=1 Tax=Alteromonas sp. AMM-1 TaxID=3394233 RepID=UPI0039A6E75F
MREEFITDGQRRRSVSKVFLGWLFWGVCYAIGWPVCKVFTLGSYPHSQSRERAIFRHQRAHTGFSCAMVGLIVLSLVVAYFTGYLPALTLR